MLFLLSPPAWACFSLIAGKAATASHHVILARNSDSKDANRAKQFKIYHTTTGVPLYNGLPYWDLMFDPSYDMAQVSSNRFGVSLSATQTIQSNRTALTFDPPAKTGQGVSEPNIPSIVMPHATSAKEAVTILGKAIETRGVNDGWGFGVLLGDNDEAWYLETLSGHQWVAIRVPDTMYFVAANGPGQIQAYLPKQYDYLLSHYNGITPITFAKQYGFADYQSGIFNFRNTYADIQQPTNRNNNYIRLAYAQHFFNPSSRAFDQNTLNSTHFPMFLQPERPITREDIQTLQSSHYEDYPELDPYQWPAHDKIQRPFYYPIANPRTSNAHITEITPPLSGSDVSISNVQYIAIGMPGFSIYFPFYFGLSHVPAALATGNNKADDISLFWQFRKVQTLVFLSDPDHAIPYDFKERQALVAARYDTLNAYIAEHQRTMEQTYARTRNPELLNQFTQDMIDVITQTNEQLIRYFMDMLQIESIYHLHTAAERNAWFTKTLRAQDCHYRRYQCDPLEPTLKAPRERYVDE